MTARITTTGRNSWQPRIRTAGMIARRDPPLRPMRDTLLARLWRWMGGRA